MGADFLVTLIETIGFRRDKHPGPSALVGGAAFINLRAEACQVNATRSLSAGLSAAGTGFAASADPAGLEAAQARSRPAQSTARMKLETSELAKAFADYKAAAK